MTTIEQLAGITAQHNDIVKRVGNGSLDPTTVKRTLQDIIEGKFNVPVWNPPSWWRTPEQQLARARQIWPNVVLPDPPAAFMPQTKSEVMLLHVPDSLNNLRNKVGIVADAVRSLKPQTAPNKVEFKEPIWLAFDPEHGSGENPDTFWHQANLAASEIFSAIIQFPGWSSRTFPIDYGEVTIDCEDLTYRGPDSPSPCFSGYRFRDWDGQWKVANLTQWPGSHGDRPAALSLWLSNPAESVMTSPSVRRC